MPSPYNLMEMSCEILLGQATGYRHFCAPLYLPILKLLLARDGSRRLLCDDLIPERKKPLTYDNMLKIKMLSLLTQSHVNFLLNSESVMAEWLQFESKRTRVTLVTCSPTAYSYWFVGYVMRLWMLWMKRGGVTVFVTGVWHFEYGPDWLITAPPTGKKVPELKAAHQTSKTQLDPGWLAAIIGNVMATAELFFPCLFEPYQYYCWSKITTKIKGITTCSYITSLFLRGPSNGLKGRLPVAAW